MELPIINCMPGYIEAEYLEKSLKWWKYQYIPQIATREPKILQYREIDEFISGATDYILKELEKII
jgi:hypothetical protein